MRHCFRGRELKQSWFLWAVLSLLSLPLAARAGGGMHDGAYVVPDPTVTTAQTPGIAHNCNKNLHTAACVKRCAKNLNTVDTPGVIHKCGKDVHNVHCVKKCVINTTEVKPTGPPPIWHVRGGQGFPVRDKQAENTMLDEIYSKKRVKATIINKTNPAR